MSTSQISIPSWSEGYRALYTLTAAHRGSLTLNAGTAEVVSWPRTTGRDLLAIALLFEGAVSQYAPDSLADRWFREIDLLAIDSERAMREAHPSNRSFWATLAIVAMQLDQQHAPLPAAHAWNLVLRELAGEGHEADTPSPAGTERGLDCIEFPAVPTWDDMAQLQLGYFRRLRGVAAVDSALVSAVPRTTVSDVLQLATYWTGELNRAGQVAGDSRYRHVYARWGTALLEVARVAKTAPLSAVYARNTEFWHSIVSLAIQVGDAVDSASAWTLYLDGIAPRADVPARNAAPAAPAGQGIKIEFPDAKTHDEAAKMQQAYFRELRGEDVVPGGLVVHIPRTTNADVAQLAAYWNKQLRKVGDHDAADRGYRHIEERWRSAAADVDQLTRGVAPNAVYARNTDFWVALMTIAVQVAVTDEAPSRLVMVVESYVQAVLDLPQTVHDLPDTLDKLPDLINKAADASWKALAGALAKPLLAIGTGLVVLTFVVRGLRGERVDRILP